MALNTSLHQMTVHGVKVAIEKYVELRGFRWMHTNSFLPPSVPWEMIQEFSIPY